MVRYFMRISYIGTKYRGSQKCPKYPNETVQGVIENALLSLNPNHVPLTSFASRTDRGVHAFMNAFHVDLKHTKQDEVYQPHFVKKMLNSYLRENSHEIIITDTSVVPQSFHARHCVNRRSYVYRLAILKPEIRISHHGINSCNDYLPISLLNRCHAVSSDLNINIVKDVVNVYCGSHDFSTFTKYVKRQPWKYTRRIIEEFKFYEIPFYTYMNDPQYSNITMWEFCIKSTSFLHNQIRKLVGSALSAGYGRISISDIESMLENPDPANWVKSRLAPPYGLYLANLEYGKEGFSGKDVLNEMEFALES